MLANWHCSVMTPIRVSEQKADSLTRIERSLHQIKQSAL
jgi:hypothetical protein